MQAVLSHKKQCLGMQRRKLQHLPPQRGRFFEAPLLGGGIGGEAELADLFCSAGIHAGNVAGNPTKLALAACRMQCGGLSLQGKPPELFRPGPFATVRRIQRAGKFVFLQIKSLLNRPEVDRLNALAREVTFVDGRISNPANETKNNLQANQSGAQYAESVQIVAAAFVGRANSPTLRCPVAWRLRCSPATSPA